MVFDYPVTLTPDGTTLMVTFTDVPEALTSGVGRDEALLHAVDALETALSFYIGAGKPLPLPSEPALGQQTVRPSTLGCAKLGIYQAMTEQGVTKTALARRLGWFVPQVSNLLDLRHESRIGRLEAAARVLGKRLEVRLV